MASSQPIYSANDEQALMARFWAADIKDNPLNFVMLAYPWGKKGTPLEKLKGPRKWQRTALLEIASYIHDSRNTLSATKALPPMFKKAVCSGRGIGKSALFAWLAHWLVSTRLGSSAWVAANGEPQLKGKTFPEIAKWVTMSENAHWFDVNATSIVPAKWLSEAVQRDLKIDPRYWYISAQLWNEENPDAFAGAHNGYGEMYLFDEASGIPTPIWTVAEGVFTEEIIDRYWLAFSNGRRNDGAFFECFHKNRDDWRGIHINSLHVEGISHDNSNAIIRQYGEDSDEARVEVYGEFPNRAENQFIGFQLVEESANREVMPDPGAPLLLGVDVARFGTDKTVLAFRKGRDARGIPWEVYKGLDTMAVATRVADAATKYRVDAIFIDGNGVGGGVVDALRAWKFKVIEVQAGGNAIYYPDQYKNRRSEMWGLCRDWLPFGAIPNKPTVKQDFTEPHYRYDPVSNKLVLEAKEDMRKRGAASPDEAEALIMTFAQTVARVDARHGYRSQRVAVAQNVDYDLFG